jgi:hypothetical protein
LKAHSPRNLRLSEGERSTLAEIGKRLGRKGPQQVARLAKPDTILGWYRKLVAEKFDGSQHRRSPGGPPSVQRSRNWWFAWPAKTPVGVTIRLWERWPIWARSLRPDRGQHPAPARHRARTGEKPNDHVERFHSSALGVPLTHPRLRRVARVAPRVFSHRQIWWSGESRGYPVVGIWTSSLARTSSRSKW